MDKLTIQTVFKHFTELFPKATSVAIANTTEFVYYHPSEEIHLPIHPGDSISDEPITCEAIMTEKVVKGEKKTAFIMI